MRMKFEILRAPADEGGGAPAPEPAAASDGPSGSTTEAIERAFANAGISDDEFVEVAPEDRSDAGTGGDGDGEGDGEGDDPQAAGGRERGPDGRFKAKAAEGAAEAGEAPEAAKADADKAKADADGAKADTTEGQGGEPPSWMSDAAKAKWSAVPVEVRADTARRVRELEGGLRQYQERAAELEPFQRHAEATGTTLVAALKNYTGMEQLLVSNPLEGLGQICAALGTDLRTVAAHVLGRPQPQSDQVISGLQQHIRQLEERLGGVTSTIQAQREAEAVSRVTQFADAHPHFDAVSDDIERMFRTGYCDPRDPNALEEAYQAAVKIRGLTTEPQTLATQTADQTRASPPTKVQDRKAGFSVQGSPSGTPGAPRKSASTGEAVARAFERVGLST